MPDVTHLLDRQAQLENELDALRDNIEKIATRQQVYDQDE
jgi:hypothetical protein